VGSLAFGPAYHGRGLARTIMAEVLDELRATGIKRVELIVESDNPKAIRFYESLGFEIEGTLRKFYKRATEDRYIDDHIMARLFD
jgi:putative acetyltransferase